MIFLICTLINLLMVTINIPGILKGNLWSLCACLFCAASAGASAAFGVAALLIDIENKGK